MIIKISSQKITIGVIVISLLIAIALGIAAWDINFWPTDARVFYLDATQKIPHLEHLSQIHRDVDTEKIRWLHGKELFLLMISFMQRLINDSETLRPFILVCIINVCLSSLLIYFISRKYWGQIPALVCWFAFTASMWPYVYILFAKHQPQGLLFFLLALWSLQYTDTPKTRKVLYLLSGIFMGISLFSSSAAAIYGAYYAAAFIYASIGNYKEGKSRSRTIKGTLTHGVIVFLGVMSVFAYVNWPDIIRNIVSYMEYVNISGSYNHFYYNQAFLKQWFLNADVARVRGGVLWIIKYFFVIMPVLFPVYLLGVFYLIRRCKQTRDNSFRRRNIGLIILSLSAPIMAEIIQAAQYGANYFPSLFGITMFVGYCVYLLRQDNRLNKKMAVTFLFWVVAGMHLVVNAHAFVTDIYPCRMVTTFLSREIKKRDIKALYTYKMQPHRNHFVLYFNPDVQKKIKLFPIDYLIQAKEGYILLPPITGDSLYIASISTYTDFDDDVFLNELVSRGKLQDYAVTSFKTMANSRIWLHEEEIFSYRKLILNHKFKGNDIKGRVWLLDGKKIDQDARQNVPNKEYLYLAQKNFRNIGTKKRLYIYEGYTGKIQQPKKLRRLLARLYKVGNPKDSLRAYIYTIDKKQVVWVRHGENFASDPLSSDTLGYNEAKGLAAFRFDPPVKLNRGAYFFMIYRTGEPDDENFYRMNNGELGML